MQKLSRKCLTYLRKEIWMKKMNGSFLKNQARSCELPYTSQIAEKASFFDSLFRVWFDDG